MTKIQVGALTSHESTGGHPESWKSENLSSAGYGAIQNRKDEHECQDLVQPSLTLNAEHVLTEQYRIEKMNMNLRCFLS